MDLSYYSRWVSVHLRDLHALSEMHPAIASEFCHGIFTVKKAVRTFSALVLYQALEQLKAMVKSNGGEIGLTLSPLHY